MDIEQSIEKLKEIFGVEVYKGTRTYKGTNQDYIIAKWLPVWSKNLAENYQKVKNGLKINELKDKHKGKPCICIGLGVSVEKEIENIKKIKNSVIIVANRAYRICIANGIKPDYVMIFDSHQERYKDFKGCPKNIPLITHHSMNPKVLEGWDKVYYFRMWHPGIQFFDSVLPAIYPDIDCFPNLGSVGNSMVVFANYIGCKPIVLIGYDLKYVDGKYRADDYERVGNKWKRVSNEQTDAERKQSAVMYNGEMTENVMITYKNALERLYKTNFLHIIDCSNGILDLPKMKLSEAIKEFRL